MWGTSTEPHWVGVGEATGPAAVAVAMVAVVAVVGRRQVVGRNRHRSSLASCSYGSTRGTNRALAKARRRLAAAEEEGCYQCRQGSRRRMLGGMIAQAG